MATANLVTETGFALPYGLKVEDLALPGGIFFHAGHTWAGIDAGGKVKVGLDDFVQRVLGRIDGIKPSKVGATVNRGDKIFSLVQGKRKADFHSPVDGVISAINEEVINNPAVLKENPYEKGWIYTIKPTNLAQDIKSLSIAEEAMNWIKNEVQKFKEFLAEQFVNDKMLGKTMADGGLPVEGIMEYMDDFSWMKLQEEFLTK
jgi:glycine cleavage system H lipoate-binding protein